MYNPVHTARVNFENKYLQREYAGQLCSHVTLGLDSLGIGTLRKTCTGFQNIQCSFMESHYLK